MYHLALLNGYVCSLKNYSTNISWVQKCTPISLLAAIPNKEGPWYLALSLDVNTDCTYFLEMNSEQFKQLMCNGKWELEIPFFPGKHWNKRRVWVCKLMTIPCWKVFFEEPRLTVLCLWSQLSSWPVNTVTLTVLPSILLAANCLL